MNYKLMRYVIGWLIIFESVFMFFSGMVAVIYRERALHAFLVSMLFGLVIGGLFIMKKPKDKSMYAKDGFVIVSVSWLVLSLYGAVPFVLSHNIPDVLNAVFESVSGFTTTGATILGEIESLEKSILFWRSFTHWIGGMGVLVFIMAILPLAGGSNIYLMKAESTGPDVSKLVPRMRNTAVILYSMYFGLTIVEMVLLLLAGMSPYEAVTTAFSTAGTGGFAVKNNSLAGYSPAIQNIVTIFMILFGVNFNVYYLLLCRKVKAALYNTELKVYIAILAISSIVVAINISHIYGSFGIALQQSAFQIASMMSSTGFATTDFNLWPEFSKMVLVLVMMIGACAGSTGGGIKVSRIVILAKSLKKELEVNVHPRNIKKIKLNGRLIEHEVIRSVNTFMVAYIAIYAISVLIISLDNFDFTTSFTAVSAMINNTGPGLAAVGPAENFAKFSILSKCVCIFDMLAGRLELFPLLILLSPTTWKK